MSSEYIPILWVIRSDGDGRWLPGHWPGYGRDAGKAEPVISSYQCQGRDRLQSAMLHSCGSVIRSFRSTVSKRCAFSAYMSHLFCPYFEQLDMNFNIHAFVTSRQNIAFSRAAYYKADMWERICLWKRLWLSKKSCYFVATKVIVDDT